MKALIAAALAASALAWTWPASAEGVEEDSPEWSCVDDGNRVCGPGNANGVTPGCFDDGGVLEAYWPCHVEIDPRTGDTDIFEDGNPIPVYVY